WQTVAPAGGHARAGTLFSGAGAIAGAAAGVGADAGPALFPSISIFPKNAKSGPIARRTPYGLRRRWMEPPGWPGLPAWLESVLLLPGPHLPRPRRVGCRWF